MDLKNIKERLKMEILYSYSGYESTSKREHVASVQMMEDCIEQKFDVEAEVDDDKNNFCGVLTIDIDDVNAEEVIEALEEYCEPGYDNELGGYYDFEIL